jgi:septal ring factor EnvC (AmiA/AmiB activator)
MTATERPVDLVFAVPAEPPASRLPHLDNATVAAAARDIADTQEHTAVTQPNLDQLKTDIATLTAANNTTIAELGRHGVQIDVTPVRIAALAEHLFGDMDQPDRLAHEQHIQEQLVEQLGAVRSQIARQQLLSGVNGANLPLANGLKP